MNKLILFFFMLFSLGCSGMVENTKPMLVNRWDRMKLENNMMFAIVQGDYYQAKAQADRTMKSQGYGKHLHDLPEYKIFVYGKEIERIKPQYRAAHDSIRVALRFYQQNNGTTRIEVMNSSKVRGLTELVDEDMPSIVKALSE